MSPNNEFKLHGKSIPYSQIKKIPRRTSFLDKKLRDDVRQKIKGIEDLLFMPNHLHEMHLQNKKYDKATYRIVLFGVFTDGRRATVVINGIKPYFEVVVKNADEAVALNQRLSQNKFSSPVDYEITRGKQFKGYREKQQTFAKFSFNKLKERRTAIEFIRQQGYETTSDDLNSFYRVVCRDNLASFSTWAVLSNYSVREYTSIRGATFNVDIKNFKKCTLDIMTNKILAQDKTMTMCWDIETYSEDGQIPLPHNPDHRMFMIGITFQWHYANNALLKVCLVDFPCKPKPGYVTIVCGNEKKLIKAFGKLVFKMAPEIILGFNDGGYDWPWLVKRARSYPGTLSFLAECFNHTKHWKNYDDADIYKYNFKTEKVKLESDMDAEGRTLTFPGYLNVDVRTVFRQIYKTAENSSLNFFLKRNKLQGKKDMPYQEMFGIYRLLKKELDIHEKITNGISSDFANIIISYMQDDTYIDLISQMGEVAEYCVIDSQRCHDLMKIRSVIMDRREMANLSYTSVFDGFYRADGMKVRNIVIARGQPNGLRFSNITADSSLVGKYPGAYVFPPKKGLVTSKMTIKERIDSGAEKYNEWDSVTDKELDLYYKIIEIFGVAPTPKEMTQLREKAETLAGNLNLKNFRLKKCFIDFMGDLTGRPITGLDFSSLYPSLIMAYNLSPEYIITDKKQARELHAAGHNLHKIKFVFGGSVIRGWSIRHDNKIDPDSPDCKFGIYPMILKELFDTRKLMKKNLHKWESLKETMEALPDDEFNKEETKATYEDVCFNFNYINSKQKALKTFMNTFYGESGNKRSPFFVLQLAGGITAAGKANIKLVQKIVEALGYIVFYGDTDSLYVAVPDKFFKDVDIMYYTGKMTKKDYWNKLIEITFREIKIINKIVNDALIEDNGTLFLKMAYEEALFPVAFLAKKKYFGIPHISIANFAPKNLFIRGLEVKKRGVSEMLKKICMSIMWDSVSMENQLTLLELVHKKIDEIYKTDWDFEDFIMTGIYKPNKQNVKMHVFAARMKADGITVKPYERLKYVIAQKNPFKYDHRGRKQKLSVGEKMEFADRAAEHKMKIDIDYYMTGSVNGQLARLITYEKMFHVEPASDDLDDMKTADIKTYKNATKYVGQYVKRYQKTYKSKGKLYQKIFKVANAEVVKNVNRVCGEQAGIILKANYDVENFDTWLSERAEKAAIKCVKNYGQTYITDKIRRMNDADAAKAMPTLQKIYFGRRDGGLLKQREKLFVLRRDELQSQLHRKIGAIVRALDKQTAAVTNVANAIKANLNIDNMYNEVDAIIPTFANVGEIDNSAIIKNAAREFNAIASDKDAYNAIQSMQIIYINMKSNYSFIHETRSIVDYLKMKRNASLNYTPEPAGFDLDAHIRDAVEDLVAQGL